MDLKFRNQPFVPALLGSDIGAYSMARAFYESYGVQSHVFGKFPTGPCWKSHLTPYMGQDELDRFMLKDRFYRLCDDLGIDHPATVTYPSLDSSLPPLPFGYPVIVKPADSGDYFLNHWALCDDLGIDHPATVTYPSLDSSLPPLPFGYPVIVKPADSGDYFLNHWAGQKKAYTVDSKAELLAVTRTMRFAPIPGGSARAQPCCGTRWPIGACARSGRGAALP